MSKNDDAVPRYVVRQELMLARMTLLAHQNMNQICAVLSPEQQSRFETFANIEIRPSVDDLLKLIELAEERGLFSTEEAAMVKAGRYVENPLPDTGGGV